MLYSFSSEPSSSQIKTINLHLLKLHVVHVIIIIIIIIIRNEYDYGGVMSEDC